MRFRPSTRHLVVAAALVCGTAGRADAVFQSYVNNPTTNSTDWNTAVVGLGGVVNTNVNFDTHPLGALNNNFYTVSDGVTFSTVGNVNTVQNGTGPNDGNTSTPPLSPGEGPHPASNFLFNGNTPSALTITFANPVVGAGLFTIDYFNPTGTNPLTIEAFTGPNGTGASLGSASSVAFNFQPNNLYFMGVSSTAGDIWSIVFTKVSSSTGDNTGIDNIRFAVRQQGPLAVPAPAGLVLAAFGVVSAAGFVRRKRVLA